MKIPLFVAVCGLLLLSSCSSDDFTEGTITYEVRFPNAVHNETEITLLLEGLDTVPVHLTMSRTSPGRYALHEFAKNVYEVIALDGEGDTLEIHRPDLHNWVVSGHDGTIRFTYTLYANHADGTYSGVNEEHAHLNIPATFIWPRNMAETPVTVTFHPPGEADWDVATQLQPAEGEYSFTAPDRYYFLDSPTQLSEQDVEEWTVASDTAEYRIRLAVHHNGTAEDVARFADMARRVVDEQIAIFGEPAPFDYGTYTFIADYLPYVYRDGMEHRNSTILTSRQPLEGDGALTNLYTLSHEFFHTWNVERLRPRSLEPFNFTAANVSGSLWFAEGFTSYYDDLTIRRSGLISDSVYAAGISGLLNLVINAPGRSYHSPVEMSQQAPFVDAATSVDAQNRGNTFVSYYSWGAVIGMGLDLELRSRYDTITLDTWMKALWDRFGKTEEPYSLNDLQETLAEVTGSEEFASGFFDRQVYGSSLSDFDSLLTQAGMLLRKANEGQAVIAHQRNLFEFSNGGAEVTANTRVGSPLYESGINVGDLILEIDGRTISGSEDVQQVLQSHRPGDTVTVRFESLGHSQTTELTLGEDPALEVVLYEDAGRELTDEMRSFRDSWLGSRSDGVRSP